MAQVNTSQTIRGIRLDNLVNEFMNDYRKRVRLTTYYNHLTMAKLVLCQESGQFKLRLQTMLRPVRNDSHSKAVQKPWGSYNHSDYESVLYCSKHQYIRSKDDVLHECL